MTDKVNLFNNVVYFEIWIFIYIQHHLVTGKDRSNVTGMISCDCYVKKSSPKEFHPSPYIQTALKNYWNYSICIDEIVFEIIAISLAQCQGETVLIHFYFYSQWTNSYLPVRPRSGMPVVFLDFRVVTVPDMFTCPNGIPYGNWCNTKNI